MPTTFSTALKLDIPQTPETVDPELFKEMIRVYNSLQIIADKLNTLEAGTALPAAATNAATTQTLVNEIRTLLISLGIAS